MEKFLKQHNINNPKYNNLVRTLEKEGTLILEPEILTDEDVTRQLKIQSQDQVPSSTETLQKVNPDTLRKAWDTSQRSQKDDWVEWMRGFSISLLKESPSPALRSVVHIS